MKTLVACCNDGDRDKAWFLPSSMGEGDKKYIIRSKAMTNTKQAYDSPVLKLVEVQVADVIRTSAVEDPFDDGYRDPTQFSTTFDGF